MNEAACRQLNHQARTTDTAKTTSTIESPELPRQPIRRNQLKGGRPATLGFARIGARCTRGQAMRDHQLMGLVPLRHASALLLV